MTKTQRDVMLQLIKGVKTLTRQRDALFFAARAVLLAYDGDKWTDAVSRVIAPLRIAVKRAEVRKHD